MTGATAGSSMAAGSGRPTDVYRRRRQTRDERVDEILGVHALDVEVGVEDGHLDAQAVGAADEAAQQQLQLGVADAAGVGRVDGRHHRRVEHVDVEVHPEADALGELARGPTGRCGWHRGRARPARSARRTRRPADPSGTRRSAACRSGRRRCRGRTAVAARCRPDRPGRVRSPARAPRRRRPRPPTRCPDAGSRSERPHRPVRSGRRDPRRAGAWPAPSRARSSSRRRARPGTHRRRRSRRSGRPAGSSTGRCRPPGSRRRRAASRPGRTAAACRQPASRAPSRATRPWSRSAPGALAQPGTDVAVGGRSPDSTARRGRRSGASADARRASEQRVREGAPGARRRRGRRAPATENSETRCVRTFSRSSPDVRRTRSTSRSYACSAWPVSTSSRPRAAAPPTSSGRGRGGGQGGVGVDALHPAQQSDLRQAGRAPLRRPGARRGSSCTPARPRRGRPRPARRPRRAARDPRRLDRRTPPALSTASIHCRSWASGTTPVKASTGCPPTTANTIGMPCTRNAWAMRGLASTSILASTQEPPPSTASFSSTGESCLHGPHQSAQKSITTGVVQRPFEHLGLEGRLGDVDDRDAAPATAEPDRGRRRRRPPLAGLGPPGRRWRGGSAGGVGAVAQCAEVDRAAHDRRNRRSGAWVHGCLVLHARLRVPAARRGATRGGRARTRRPASPGLSASRGR